MAGYLDRVSVLSGDNIYFQEKRKSSASVATNVSTHASEISYAYLCTRDELVETLTFLNFELPWMFFATLASVILYGMFTYAMVFENSYDLSPLETGILIICSIIIVVDIASAILHIAWGSVAARRDVASQNKGLVTLDVISVISLLYPLFPSNIAPIYYVALGMECFRIFRVFRFFHSVSHTANINTTATLLKKYVLLFILFVHTLACIWQLVGCYAKCDPNELDWTHTVNNTKYISDFDRGDYYIICVYYTITMITTVGFGDIHGFTTGERALTMIMMLIGYTFFTATFLGGWTAVQVEHYRRHAQFSNKLRLIRNYMTHPRIPNHMHRKLHAFYLSFWYQKGAIRTSVLFDSLPRSLQQEVLVDSYWFFLQQSFFLRHADEAFKRAVAVKIQTKILTEGERLYDQGKERRYVVYVASGSVCIHSAHDNESTILTLGIGTLLGEFSLVCNCKSPVKVTASGFCVIQMLQKRDFWRVANKYVKLKQVDRLHEKFKMKLNEAQKTESLRDIARRTGGSAEKALKVVKALLKVEEPKTDEGYFHRVDTEEETRIYSDLYTLSRVGTKIESSDDIFARTSWPWTLRPTSSFLTIWEYTVVVTVLFVAIIYPYKYAFDHVDEKLTITAVAIDTIYILDFILQTCTAVEIDNVIFSDVPDIFLLRMQQPSYVIDLMATIPYDHIALTLHVSEDKGLISLLSARRLLKIQRVVGNISRIHYITAVCFQALYFVNNLGNNFEFNIPLVRSLKYILYLLMCVYFMGTFYYMIACYRGVCNDESWWSKLVEEDGDEGIRHKHPFAVSMYFAMLVLSQTGYGDIYATNRIEMYVMSVFFIIGMLTFSYLVADYSATLMLSNRAIITYQETVMIIRDFLIDNHIVPSIQSRVNSFLLMQWDEDKGYRISKNKSFLYDCPEQLNTLIVTTKYSQLLRKVPLFQEVRHDFIAAVCVACQPIFLPPNEMVIYGGETAREMFMIEKGKCLVISAVSGKVEKVLGPNSNFCVLETLLIQPALYNIQTVTHVELVRISYDDFKSALKKFPLVAADIEFAVQETLTEMAVSRLFIRRTTVTYQEMQEEDTSSWYIFPKKKLHPRNIDYIWGFRKPGFLNIFRLLLFRRTIIPNGHFIMFWEISRAICAFLTGIIYPQSVYMDALYPNFVYYIIILDVFAVLDIYIRFHVGYYNKRGVLVTHPKFTAQYYITHAFALDVVAVLPIAYSLDLFTRMDYTDPDSVNQYYSSFAILSFNKLIQMYRVPDAFAYFQRDPMKRKGVLFNIMRFLPIALVFLNFLTCIILNITSKMVYDEEDNKIKIKFLENTWLHQLNERDPSFGDDVMRVYFATYYWVTQTCMATGFGDIVAKLPNEMYFVIFSIIAGYLMFTFVLVVISSSIINVNSNLTTYQQYVKHLITYLKKEKIEQKLRLKTIDHFEYIWKRTHGLDTNQILKKCHRALRQDCALSLYEQTMMEVPIFCDLGRTFFRQFGIHLEEAYFLKDNPIVKLNDIVSTLYIIHKGEAIVKGPDGSIFTVLTRGCIFGNIDNVASTRSMITVIAGSSVDLLAISTMTMYTLAEEYPALRNRMRSHILFENLSYVGKSNKSTSFYFNIGKDADNENDTEKHFEDKPSRLLLSAKLKLICMLTAFASCIIVFYHMSFQDHSYAVWILTYVFDIFHIVKMAMNFTTPYKNKIGEVVTNKKAIRKRYLSSYRFYFDLFTLIPFELFALAAPREDWLFYLSLLRLNKMFRVLEISTFFNVSCENLNVNVLTYKLGTIFVYLFLLLHIGTCVLYLVGCPGSVCKKNRWTFSQSGENFCNVSYYFCSFYFMTAISTGAGIGDFVPRHISEMIVVTILIICIKFVVAVFLGEMSALVQTYTYSLVNFDHGMLKLKGFMKNNDVSQPLVKRILAYSSHLWRLQKGKQLPTLLQKAPQFLKEQIKVAAYGHHLYENYIFMRCHQDFVRVLITMLAVRTFFAGDTICQQGDINNCMYFIHRGKVEVLTMEQNLEVLVDILYERDCFGVVQGLLFKTPHTHTFKAATKCVILTLELDSWVYLLRFFPSARYEIYEKVTHVI